MFRAWKQLLGSHVIYFDEIRWDPPSQGREKKTYSNESRIKSLISTNSRHVSCAGSNLAWLRGELIWGGGKSKQKESLPIIRTGQRVAAPSTMFTTTPSQVFISLGRIFFFEMVTGGESGEERKYYNRQNGLFLGIFRCQIMRLVAPKLNRLLPFFAIVVALYTYGHQYSSGDYQMKIKGIFGTRYYTLICHICCYF